MTVKNEKETNPTEILIPETRKIVYGGKEYEVKKLSVKKILSLLRLLSKSEHKIRVAIEEGFQRAFSEQKAEFGEELEATDVKYTTLDMIVDGLEVVAENEMFKLISIILEVDEEEAKEGFSIAGVLGVLVEVVNNEEIEKLFLELATLSEKMKFTK